MNESPGSPVYESGEHRVGISHPAPILGALDFNSVLIDRGLSFNRTCPGNSQLINKTATFGIVFRKWWPAARSP